MEFWWNFKIFDLVLVPSLALKGGIKMKELKK